MASTPLAADEDSRQHPAAHLTIGWFAKRSALWLLMVATGIGAACFLYAYAADSDELDRSQAAAASTYQGVAKAP